MKHSRRGHRPRKAPKGADCLFLAHIHLLEHHDCVYAAVQFPDQYKIESSFCGYPYDLGEELA